MADSVYTSIRNQFQTPLRGSQRLHSAKKSNSIAEKRRASKQSIQRLEAIIALQEERLRETHQSGMSPSHIAELRASIEDVLLIYKYSLTSLRQSAKTLELSWAMGDT